MTRATIWRTSSGLEFTPLEFETLLLLHVQTFLDILEFTPLEFETGKGVIKGIFEIRLEFTPLEFETQ